MWTYLQSTGELLHDGERIGQGYSGAGDGKDNPVQQAVRDVGPIPCGQWRIGAPYDSDAHGPFVLPLFPVTGTEAFGRDGFLMHGDSASHPGAASHGCIVLSRALREAVYMSADRNLEVRSGVEDQPTEVA